MNKFISKVFIWFGLGLLITFLVAFYTSTNIKLMEFIFSISGNIIIVILEFAIAIYLLTNIHKMDIKRAKYLYLGYSALTGLTLSTIFLVYELTSIIWIFLASSLIFIIFAYLGKITNMDLRKFGTYLMISLLAIIILEIINIFLANNTLDMILCVSCLVIFVMYVAYDIRKIISRENTDEKYAIIGAFDLYLDFINIFLRLLELFGKRRN